MGKKLLFAGFSTVDIIEGKNYLGGAAGASCINASKLGYESSLISVLGKDELSNFYKSQLLKNNVNIDNCLFTAPSVPTCIIRNQKNNENVRFWQDNGTLPFFNDLKISQDKLSQFDLIFAFNSPYTLLSKLAKVNQRKIIYIPGPQIVNRKNKVNAAVLRKSYIILGNQNEEKKILEANPFKQGVKILAITLGNKGGYVMTNKIKTNFTSSKIKKITDTTGAGDAFALGFSLSLLNYQLPDYPEINTLKDSIYEGKRLAKLIISRNGSVLY